MSSKKLNKHKIHEKNIIIDDNYRISAFIPSSRSTAVGFATQAPAGKFSLTTATYSGRANPGL